MSFSMDIKNELSEVLISNRHCAIAELAAMVTSICDCRVLYGTFAIRLVSENKMIPGRFAKLVKEIFGAEVQVMVRNQKQFAVYVLDPEISLKILQVTKTVDSKLEICENIEDVSRIVIAQSCCKRAFLRGCFLCCGSMGDPNKIYHLEFVCRSEERAFLIRDVIAGFGIDGKIITRKGNYLVYIKESEDIVDLLNVMGAHKALLELENVRVFKTVRNDINRRVNCEAANLNKTISAAVKEVADIEYIRDHYGIERLPDALKEIAWLRLENTESSLKEIGQMLNPPLGKSGVNHRLKKLSQIACDLKGKELDDYNG